MRWVCLLFLVAVAVASAAHMGQPLFKADSLSDSDQILVAMNAHQMTVSVIQTFEGLKDLKFSDIDANVRNLQVQQGASDQANMVGNQVGSLIGGSDPAKSLSTTTPRFGFSADIADLGRGGDKAASYGIGVGIQAGFGLVLLIVTFLGCFCFCCCRCCKCSCCPYDPDPAGYSKCDRWGRLAVMVLFVLVSLVFCILGFVANNSVSSGFSGPSGISSSFVGLILNASKTINNLVGSLGGVGSAVNTAVTQIGNILGSVDFIVTDVSNLGISMGKLGTSLTAANFIANPMVRDPQATSSAQRLVTTAASNTPSSTTVTIVYGGVTVPSLTLPLKCPVCGVSGGLSTTAADQINKLVAPGGSVRGATDVVKSVNGTLVGIGASISKTINDAAKTLNDTAGKTINPIKDQINDIKTQMDNGDNYRNLGTLVILALPCIAVLAIIFGGALKLPPCFTFNWCMAGCTSCLVFIIMIITMPIAVLFADGCGYVSTVDKDLKSTFSGQTGAVLDSCMNGSPLLDALGLAANLNFTNQVQFPSLSISNTLQFPALKNMTDTVAALRLNYFIDSTSGGNGPQVFSSDMVDKALQVLNTISQTCGADATGTTNPPYTRWDCLVGNSDLNFPSGVQQCVSQTRNTNIGNSQTCTCTNCAGPWANPTSGSPLQMARQAAYQLVNLEQFLNQTLANMTTASSGSGACNGGMGSVNACNTQLAADGAIVDTNIASIKQKFDPVKEATDAFVRALTCTFIGDFYRNLKNAICVNIVGGLSMLSLSFFMIGVVNWVIIMLSVTMAKRINMAAEDQPVENKNDFTVEMGGQPGYGLPGQHAPVQHIQVARPPVPMAPHPVAQVPVVINRR